MQCMDLLSALGMYIVITSAWLANHPKPSGVSVSKGPKQLGTRNALTGHEDLIRIL